MSKELEQAIKDFVPLPEVKIEYRLYYDANGKPISMSSHAHPEGNYIVISKDVYDRSNYNYRVINNKLEPIDSTTAFRVQLKKSTSGIPVVAGHASIPVERTENYNNVEYYDRNY